MKIFLLKLSLLLLIFLVTVRSGYSQNDKERQRQYNIDKNFVAIKGYDPVAYVKQQKALKGKPSFAMTFHGIVYHFSSTGNLEIFKSNPSLYEPAYGGWCAYAMGNSGEKVEVDPETFKVINGKTYLFYNFYFNNTLKDWNKDEKNLKAKADKNWSTFIKD